MPFGTQLDALLNTLGSGTSEEVETALQAYSMRDIVGVLAQRLLDVEESGGGSSLVFHGEGDPVSPLNSAFDINPTGAPNTSGTFKLTVDGQTTAPLAYNISADALVAALEALSTVGAGNVIHDSSSTTANGFIEAAFVGDLAATPVVIALSNDTTDHGVSLSAFQVGAPGTPAGATAVGSVYIDETHLVGGDGGITLGISGGLWILSLDHTDNGLYPAWRQQAGITRRSPGVIVDARAQNLSSNAGLMRLESDGAFTFADTNGNDVIELMTPESAFGVANVWVLTSDATSGIHLSAAAQTILGEGHAAIWFDPADSKLKVRAKVGGSLINAELPLT